MALTKSQLLNLETTGEDFRELVRPWPKISAHLRWRWANDSRRSTSPRLRKLQGGVYALPRLDSAAMAPRSFAIGLNAEATRGRGYREEQSILLEEGGNLLRVVDGILDYGDPRLVLARLHLALAAFPAARELRLEFDVERDRAMNLDFMMIEDGAPLSEAQIQSIVAREDSAAAVAIGEKNRRLKQMFEMITLGLRERVTYALWPSVFRALDVPWFQDVPLAIERLRLVEIEMSEGASSGDARSFENDDYYKFVMHYAR